MSTEIKSWRAWYSDGSIRNSQEHTWLDGAKRVLIMFKDDCYLVLNGDHVKNGKVSLEIELKAEQRVVELKFTDGFAIPDR